MLRPREAAGVRLTEMPAPRLFVQAVQAMWALRGCSRCIDWPAQGMGGQGPESQEKVSGIRLGMSVPSLN